MMNERLSGRAKEIIERLKYATVATSSRDGRPWNTPVFMAYDSDYNIYWGSHREVQHSRNVRDTGQAFLVIYDSTVTPGAGEGVYIEATVTELVERPEIEAAHRLLWDRHEVPYWKLEQVGGVSPVQLYRARPERAWMNDEGEVEGAYIDIRSAVTLRRTEQ